jgi:hypothetical protein
MTLNIGVAGESLSDISDLLTLCNMVLRESGNKVRSKMKHRFSNRTKIRPKHLRKFKEHYSVFKNPPKVIIIFTDKDTDGNVKNDLMEKVRDLSIQQDILYVIPDRNFENWIIMDIYAVNSILNSSLSIPKENSSGKNWLNQQVGQYAPRKDYNKIRSKIVSKINIDSIKSPSFTKFKLELKNLFAPKIEKITRIKKGKNSKEIERQIYKIGLHHRKLPKDRTRR